MGMLSNMSSNYDNQPTEDSQLILLLYFMAGFTLKMWYAMFDSPILQPVVVFISLGSLFFHQSSSNLKFFQV